MSSNLHRRVLEQAGGMAAPPPRLGLPPRGPPTNRSNRARGARDYSAVAWDKYFASREVVETREGRNNFVVYARESPSSGTAAASGQLPVVLLLHGGGFSALTWSLFAADITNRQGWKRCIIIFETTNCFLERNCPTRCALCQALAFVVLM